MTEDENRLNQESLSEPDELDHEELQEEYRKAPYVYRVPQPEKKRGGFLAGFLTAAILGLLAVSIILIVKRQAAHVDMTDVNTKLDSFKQLIEEQYLFDSDVDYDSGILKGYIEALGDPYSVYYTADEFADLKESSSGTYNGIGVTIQQMETGSVTIVRVFKGSPAEEAGIQKDDVVTKIEGEEVTDMDLNLVVAKVRGAENTFVHMTVYRPSESRYLEMDVMRKKISVETVTHKMLENQVGYIEVQSFDEVTAGQFKEAFADLKNQGMTSVIVDLRDNGGGLLSAVVEMLDYLLPEGTLTYTEDKNGDRQYYKSDKSAALEVPMAVLTNGNTASASELFTGAVKDYHVAVQVGTKTFGKGIVQTIYSLPDGTGIKITTSRYYSPSGTCIHGEGFTPDIIVEGKNTEDDEVLQRAVEELTK